MKISTKGRYGLRAMVDLAVNSGQDQVSLKSIAERQNISENYLEQVFSALRKAGLVKSVKGAQGGYVLADRAQNISVGNVLRALEGELAVVEESSGEDGAGSIEVCLSKNVWGKINLCVNEVVDSVTLEDLAVEYQKTAANQSLMYYI